MWCSQTCRRAASLERATTAEPVRVVEVHRVRDVTLNEAVRLVLASPRAVENVLRGLAEAALEGDIPEHSYARLAVAADRVARLIPPKPADIR